MGTTRDIAKGPTNSYWGSLLNKFLDGGPYEDFKFYDISCFNEDAAFKCAKQFREFRKRYMLPIDIFKMGDTVRVMHLERPGADLITICEDNY